jgi:hypothetical protein
VEGAQQVGRFKDNEISSLREQVAQLEHGKRQLAEDVVKLTVLCDGLKQHGEELATMQVRTT